MKHLKKTIPFHMLILAGLLPVVSTASADNPNDTGNTPSSAPAPEPQSKEIAFLGIETTQVDAATRTRLKLAEGTGLRVQFIAPQSPAASILQVGDVLVRLDDQILCNHNQLRALVRSKKPKDVVTLNMYRDGQVMDVKITLGKIDVPGGKEAEISISREVPFSPDVHFRFDGKERSLREMLRERMADTSGGIITMDPDVFKDIPEEAREMLRDMQQNARQRLEKMQQEVEKLRNTKQQESEKFQEAQRQEFERLREARQRHLENWKKQKADAESNNATSPEAGKKIEITDEDGNPASMAEAESNTLEAKGAKTRVELHDGAVSATTVIRDNDGNVIMTMRNNSREVVIKDKAGKVIFEGPVNTEEERAAMSAQARKRLELLEQLSGGIRSAPSAAASPGK